MQSKKNLDFNPFLLYFAHRRKLFFATISNKGALMFLLKFLSSTSLYLLLLGNAAAECVDLSGTYLCEDEMITLSKTSDARGFLSYSITAKINGIEQKSIPLYFRMPKAAIPTVTCTKNQMETTVETSLDTITITLVLEEKILTIHNIAYLYDVTRPLVREMTCHKQ